jgi:lipoprotein NlpI
MKAILIIIIAAISVTISGCDNNSYDKETSIDKLYVSYYPSRNNYDFDSIKIGDKTSIIIDTLFAAYTADLKYEHADRYDTQKLLPVSNLTFRNQIENNPNMPFVWEESGVNNFDVSLDSVRRYLKIFILKKNNFSIYSKENGYQRLYFSDTSNVVLKELYGGL